MWSEYPWGAHGEDGVALVRKFWVQRNVWPSEIMPFSSMVPFAPARTHKEHNMWMQQRSIPRATQQRFAPIRRVQFWVYGDVCQTDYKRKCLTGPPPKPSGTLAFATCAQP